MHLAEQLIKWQKQHGRHDLPWQKTRDPYRRWISEIMLQQTQVTTVIPHYLRFIEAFPDVRTLAAASEDDVLRHWAGLGYYARGRNLLACAKAVMASGGEFPKNREALEALPGIGRSTAAAILSSCWDMPEAILDGNAKRVFARYFGVKRGESETLYQKRLWEIAEETVPQKECSIYTQALMDLGSMVCRRSRPDCGSCPLRDGCKGFASGDPSAFPGVKKRAEKPVRSSSFLVIRSESRLWVVRREMKGVWQGLYCFPEAPHEEEAPDPAALLPEGAAVRLPLRYAGRLPHEFTHYRLEMHFWEGDAVPDTLRHFTGGKWVSIRDADAEALPSPVLKFIQTRFAGILDPRELERPVTDDDTGNA